MGGGEFTSDEFKTLCDKSGIKKQLTAPYTPQQNGVVERKNRTIMGLVRSMLKEKELPLELWGEAINTCVYVRNRSSTKGVEGKTPYEKWKGSKLNVSHLRIFGSVAFVKTTGRLSKLEDRSKCMLFMGYEARSKAEQPASYSLAAKQEEWREAMMEEISAILKHKMWTMVKPQGNIKPIGVKWVFRVKKDSMGRILRYKERLLVKGYAQKGGNRLW